VQTASQDIVPHSFIEDVGECDAEFYGHWLIMAGRAERYWKELLSEPKFSRRIERLTCAFIPDFGIAATALLSGVLSDRANFAINLWEEAGEEFTMMVHMGFFKVHRRRYRLNLPKIMNAEIVKSAALKLSRTQDRQFDLHPEKIVVTAPIKNSAKRGYGNRYAIM
jgi:hypothetical protein